MIPLRYLGIIHAFGLIWREEGMKGLFRGYTAFMAATFIYLLTVPFIAELIIVNSTFYGNEKRGANEAL